MSKDALVGAVKKIMAQSRGGDVEGSYDVTDSAKVSLGVRNVFDNFPDRDKIGESATNGRIYRSDMIVDWQGGFYYARLALNF